MHAFFWLVKIATVWLRQLLSIIQIIHGSSISDTYNILFLSKNCKKNRFVDKDKKFCFVLDVL